jgi:hypothetical protein
MFQLGHSGKRKGVRSDVGYNALMVIDWSREPTKREKEMDRNVH